MIPAFIIAWVLGYHEGRRKGFRLGLKCSEDREWIRGFVDGLRACRKYGPPDRGWNPDW